MSSLNFHQIIMIDGTRILVELTQDLPIRFHMVTENFRHSWDTKWEIDGFRKIKHPHAWSWVTMEELLNSTLTSSDVLAILYQIWDTLTQLRLKGDTDPEQCLRAFNSERNTCSQLGALDWKPYFLGMPTA